MAVRVAQSHAHYILISVGSKYFIPTLTHGLPEDVYFKKIELLHWLFCEMSGKLVPNVVTHDYSTGPKIVESKAKLTTAVC